jgi:ATP synthase protein I
MNRNKQPWRAETRRIAAMSSLGLMLPSSIAVGLFIGYLLDKALGTRPWMLILFFFLGMVSGIFNLLRGLNKLQREKGKDEMKNDG